MYVNSLLLLLLLLLQDPISDGGPLGDWSVNTMPTLPTSAPGYDGEPVFELCLCKSCQPRFLHLIITVILLQLVVLL